MMNFDSEGVITIDTIEKMVKEMAQKPNGKTNLKRERGSDQFDDFNESDQDEQSDGDDMDEGDDDEDEDQG